MVDALLVNTTTGARTSRRIELPFGAVIEDAAEEGRYLRFRYLGETYDAKLSDIDGYYEQLGGASSGPAKSSKVAPKAAAESPEPSLELEKLKSNVSLSRARIPGGWLVVAGNSVAFVPDAGHKWDGGSV